MRFEVFALIALAIVCTFLTVIHGLNMHFDTSNQMAPIFMIVSAMGSCITLTAIMVTLSRR